MDIDIAAIVKKAVEDAVTKATSGSVDTGKKGKKDAPAPTVLTHGTATFIPKGAHYGEKDYSAPTIKGAGGRVTIGLKTMDKAVLVQTLRDMLALAEKVEY